MTAATQAGKIRVAVVGTGEFGRNHARVYREIQDAELVGVFDKNVERAQAAAAEFRTHAFSTLDELRGRADAVSVAVPTAEHAKIGCRLLEMGLDVLVEKPMAKTLAEADALLDAAKRHRRLLQVGHVERFNPAVLAVEPILNHPLFFEVHRLGVFHQREQDVEVVDHQVVDHVDVKAARRKHTQPVHLEKQRMIQNGLDRQHRWVESFDVADLQQALMPLCRVQ